MTTIYRCAKRSYILKLSALVANERHLEDDLEIANTTGQRLYVEQALKRTREAIDQLHHQYSREISRVRVAAGGKL